MQKHEIEKLESEINSEAYEAFYHIGQKLLRLKRGRCWEALGLKGWNAYCASGRIEHGKSAADKYIRSSELRPKIEQVGTIRTHDWTHHQMLELCKCKTDNDAKRVARKAISQAKKSGERVTARLIAQVRDGDDETGREKKRRDAALDAASLDKHLNRMSDKLVEWRTSLEQVDLEAWDDLDPVSLTRVQAEARKFLKFLEN